MSEPEAAWNAWSPRLTDVTQGAPSYYEAFIAGWNSQPRGSVMDAPSIEALLIAHQTIRNGSDAMCLCGHVYKIGEGMYRHRAAVLAAALNG